MDEARIVEMYVKEKYTLRHISEEFNTDHHKIKRILIKHNVKITRRNSLKTFTPEHRQRIGDTRKKMFASGELIPPNLGKKMSRETNIKNMRAHLKYDVTFVWLDSFEDIEKLKYLNHSISRKRDSEGFDTEIYIQFIEKFYDDDNFNRLYTLWVKTGDAWIKPSLDHIVAKSCGGGRLIDNLQFVSWFENRSKVNIDLVTWSKMKSNIRYYL